MDQLVALDAQHVQLGVRPEVQAAWLHHRFTQIHPFQDGNERVSRAIASLVLLKADMFPLVISRDDRDKYITNLEMADAGDFGALVQFIAVLQKILLTKAIGLTIDVKPAADAEEAIVATRNLLIHLGRIIPREWLNAKAHAARLGNDILDRFDTLNSLLTSEIGSVDTSFKFFVGPIVQANLPFKDSGLVPRDQCES
jgi:hypothetical protein